LETWSLGAWDPTALLLASGLPDGLRPLR
jgi:hypothetical protein